MGIIRKTLFAGTLTAATALGYLNASTVVVRPLPPRDPLFSSKLWKRHNAYKNPAIQDICLKHIPLDDIRPELLEREGDLVLEFCRGVWSSLGKKCFHCCFPYQDHIPRRHATATHLFFLPNASVSLTFPQSLPNQFQATRLSAAS